MKTFTKLDLFHINLELAKLMKDCIMYVVIGLYLTCCTIITEENSKLLWSNLRSILLTRRSVGDLYSTASQARQSLAVTFGEKIVKVIGCFQKDWKT